MHQINRLHPKPELLLWCSSALLILIYNRAFWQTALAAQAPDDWRQMLDYVLFAVALINIQFLLFLPFISRHTLKPLLAFLFLSAAAISYYTVNYSIYFDVAMFTNVLQTDAAEATELITTRYMLHLAIYGLLPTAMLVGCQPRYNSLGHTLKQRAQLWLITTIVTLAALAVCFQSMSGLMRNHKSLRYLITPANALVSLPRALISTAGTGSPLVAIGQDANQQLPASAQHRQLLVLVVGETLRAANWQLNGYQRPTTPLLAARNDIINFSNVSACGTSTAASLPCMFSDRDRRHYSASYAASHENLLDVLAHAGFAVQWVDNQSGCKGLCARVYQQQIEVSIYPQFCDHERCFDQVLPLALRQAISPEASNQVVVLHQKGSHGPAYFRRYPPAFDQFRPSCHSEDISQCSREQIANAYDNTVLYTDNVLSDIISQLAQLHDRDAALIYVSDHGESLGELGVYLHGLPYMLAPTTQTRVPMVWWLSDSFRRHNNLDSACLSQQAGQANSHDNLFHSVLGLLSISTTLYQPALDISQRCRKQVSAVAG